MGGWITVHNCYKLAILMVNRPFTERSGGDTERYRVDSGLVEGEGG